MDLGRDWPTQYLLPEGTNRRRLVFEGNGGPSKRGKETGEKKRLICIHSDFGQNRDDWLRIRCQSGAGENGPCRHAKSNYCLRDSK
jgi:hypothetical protein